MLTRWTEPLRRTPTPGGLALVCVVALAVRLFVAAVSIGSNDILFWRRFGELVSQRGVLQAYVLDSYGAALSVAAIPFVPPLLWARAAFLKNAVFYSSFRANWGWACSRSRPPPGCPV